jgi:hypothetical protein
MPQAASSPESPVFLLRVRVSRAPFSAPAQVHAALLAAFSVSIMNTPFDEKRAGRSTHPSARSLRKNCNKKQPLV